MATWASYLLEEIQRIGDVFLPQSRLQTSLAWYRTGTAAAIVRGFLQQHPDYNPKLKAKILQSADNLFRVSKAPRPKKSTFLGAAYFIFQV